MARFILLFLMFQSLYACNNSSDPIIYEFTLQSKMNNCIKCSKGDSTWFEEYNAMKIANYKRNDLVK